MQNLKILTIFPDGSTNISFKIRLNHIRLKVFAVNNSRPSLALKKDFSNKRTKEPAKTK